MIGFERIPPILIPRIPLDPKVDSPAFLLPTPRIHKFKHGGAINLDPIEFRDRVGHYHYIPPGLACDGGSYPWLVRFLFGWDRYDPDTIRTFWLHNKDYALNDYFRSEWKKIMPRSRADEIMHDGLTIEKPNRREIIYFSVHYIGGQFVWDKVSKEKIILDWLEMLERSELELQCWIQGLISADQAA